MFTIQEKADYEVEAANAQEALALFLDYGPEVSDPVRFGSVYERDVFDANGVAQEVGEPV